MQGRSRWCKLCENVLQQLEQIICVYPEMNLQRQQERMCISVRVRVGLEFGEVFVFVCGRACVCVSQCVCQLLVVSALFLAFPSELCCPVTFPKDWRQTPVPSVKIWIMMLLLLTCPRINITADNQTLKIKRDLYWCFSTTAKYYWGNSRIRFLSLVSFFLCPVEHHIKQATCTPERWKKPPLNTLSRSFTGKYYSHSPCVFSLVSHLRKHSPIFSFKLVWGILDLPWRTKLQKKKTIQINSNKYIY